MSNGITELLPEEKLDLAEDHIRRLQENLRSYELMERQREKKISPIVPIVGQMACVTMKDYEGDLIWHYAVAVQVFDDRYQLLLENGARHMYLLDSNSDDWLDEQPRKSRVGFLYKDGQPVLGKRHWKKGYLPKLK